MDMASTGQRPSIISQRSLRTLSSRFASYWNGQIYAEEGKKKQGAEGVVRLKTKDFTRTDIGAGYRMGKW